MAVGIKVDFLCYSIGTGDFLHSFFSIICVNLENNNWGSKYPIIMKEMYTGVLSKKEVSNAKIELQQIKNKLKKIDVSQVVWDAENLELTPPWRKDISKDIKNLSEYFVTVDGRNLIEVIEEAFNEAIIKDVDIEIKEL